MTSKTTLIALSTAIALGVLGGLSAAQASNENDGGNETGGYVLPGSRDGVNLAHHRGIFANSPAATAYGFAPVDRQQRAKSRGK
jgi:hypothetical protein